MRSGNVMKKEWKWINVYHHLTKCTYCVEFENEKKIDSYCCPPPKCLPDIIIKTNRRCVSE